MTIEKGKIGFEDIEFGIDTFSRKSSAGTPITLNKVRASYLPIIDTAGKFIGEDVEAALAECAVENSDGSFVKDYTNKSGAQRVLGDVVIIDTDNDDAFENTTTLGETLVLGVVLETIAVDVAGKVASGGYVSEVKVNAATTRGQYLRTSTVATKANPVNVFTTGCFAIALSAGASTVSAYIFGGGGGGDYVPTTGGSMTGTLKLAKGADIASASALSLGTDGNYFDVTGATSITSIGSIGIGSQITLHFDEAVVLTHSADLVLPGGANYTTTEGDEIRLIEYATGDWRVVSIHNDNGITGTGKDVRDTQPTIDTPTLTTPKVDTINEETADTGVTVDGVLLKDGYVKINTTPQSDGNTITAASARWTPAEGIYQMVYVTTSGGGLPRFQLFISASWWGDSGTLTNHLGIAYFDGTNMSILEFGTTTPINFYWQKF